MLRAALRRAAAGYPRFVVVVGEIGVGKTRLVNELLRGQRAAALTGACIPLGGEGLPLTALAQGLRRLARTPAGPALIQSLPDLGSLLPATPGPTAGPGAGSASVAGPPTMRVDTAGHAASGRHGAAPPAGGPAQRLRLFSAVLSLLGSLGSASRDAGALHVVEDVHWADPATRDLVRFLATNLLDERVLVVLTCRGEELVTDSATRAWLAELGRLPRVDRLELGRLDADATARLVGSLLADASGREARPRADRPDIVAGISERSAGNPLIAQHLAWHADAGGDALPEVLSELLSARLDALPLEAAAVVDAVSVLSTARPVEVVAHVAGLPLEAAERAVPIAVRHSILRVDRDGEVDVTHPALRETAYARLLPTRRRRLHLAAGRALAELAGEGDAGAPGGPRGGVTLATRSQIARHLQLGGDLEGALDAGRRAARLAEQTPAFAEAFDNYRRVLACMDRVEHDLDPVRVRCQAARVAHLVGESAMAAELLEQALALAGGGTARAEVLEQLGYVHFMAGRGDLADEALHEAWRVLDEASPALRAKVAAGLAMQAATWSRPDEASAAAGEVVRIAAQGIARREEGRARNALGLVAVGRGDGDAVEHLEAALAIAREVADPDDLAVAWINLTHVLGLEGRDREVVTRGREGLEELTHWGLASTTGGVLLGNVVEAMLALGRYDEAWALVQDAPALHTPGMLAVPALLRAAELGVIRGELTRARSFAEQAGAVVAAADAPAGWVADVALVGAAVECWSGHPRVAVEAACAALPSGRVGGDVRMPGRLGAVGLRAVGDLAEMHRDPASRREQEEWTARLLAGIGEPDAVGASADVADVDDVGAAADDVGAAADELDPGEPAAGGDAARPADAAGPQTSPEEALLRAELSRARGASSPAAWAAAAHAWDATGRSWESAYCRWRWAEALVGAGASPEAIAVARAGHRIAAAAGFAPLVGEFTRLATWYRFDLLTDGTPGASDAEPTAPTARAVSDLTPREREVLAALTEGRTNAQIAALLGTSAKTASVHVSNILRKLDVPSRQEAARLAHRLGLV